MRNTCGKIVECAGKVLGKVGSLYTFSITHQSHGDKSKDFYPTFTRQLPTDFHSKITVVTTVFWIVLPTIHTTYKDKRKKNTYLFSY